ncbi:4-(cytidine 5'-diphospho)-2-C-methyl-D-erythritol kinase [Methylacidiphilum sp. Yel]|jgi:4-diphosphocytidyl-2-C-methyl-D-erythritol kinase|uniref:4-(cytidine 5'-diphospho)-2-C-methyl-D-erythritol kinase n=1 Tax=Methylacidiphilum sp. Yel TaxID=1847730 RepID=UPI001069ECDA|nr:4-(cytidine 5'-diphospho)-2-C-methyl-D-erythritol kinase [Methylacidiphilum sp. Yel]TFE66610.1 4-(cytidine 5'-diphospho)-2-C-methyl-D-erythritol kinase [Methylacidiphilum sp. Yel]
MDTLSYINSFAPAKINLGLRILGKRQDGYHEIRTLMAPISIGDNIYIELTESGIELETSGHFDVPKDANNLAFKAALLFLSHYSIRTGLKIKLTKVIPPGAGLGGGSSDAATVLFSLKELFGIKDSIDSLFQLAAQLGSDVPFFLLKKPALCTGRGEKLQPATIHYPRKGILFYPGFPIQTPWAYRKYRELLDHGVLHPPDPETIDQPLNDLEQVVFSKYLWLGTLKNWLIGRFHPELCLMSGSGSSLFALFRQEDPQFFESLIQEAKNYLGSCCWIRSFEILESF